MPDPASTTRIALHELSEQVARHWMGWRRTKTGWRSSSTSDPSEALGEPLFAQDARRASEALAEARRRGFHCTVRVLPTRDGGDYEVAINSADGCHDSRGPTLPEAVCRALLALCSARETTTG